MLVVLSEVILGYINAMLKTSIKDKLKNFNVAILNCPYFDSNTPSAVAYRVHTSQFIRYDRAFTKDGNLNFGCRLLPMTLCTYRED
jgi:hypothetical protein